MRLAQIHLEDYEHGQTIINAQKSLAINPMNLISRVCLVTAQVAAHGFLQSIPHLEIIVTQGENLLPNPEDFKRLLELCRVQASKSI